MIKTPLLLCLLLFGSATASERYHLDQLALGLNDAPDRIRADLAYAAISELAAAYALESRLARQEMHHQPGQRKLGRWAVAAQNLASELDALAQSVTPRSSVRTSLGPGTSLHLIVDDKPVVISGPRTTDQAGLETRIVSRFCSLHPCKRLAPLPPASNVEPLVITGDANTHWSFSEADGPLCSSDDGLAFQFDNTHDLRRKREACARVVAELNLLAAEIIRHVNSGTRVNWAALNIAALPFGEQHTIQLNNDGDVLDLYVPALAAAPDLFMLVRPWLTAKVSRVQHRTMISNAEVLLPPVGFMGQ